MPEPTQPIIDDPATIRRLQLEVRKDPWAANEAATRARLREAGRRPLGQNLSEGLDMIETLSGFVGAASKSR